MINPIDKLDPNSVVLGFFDSITGKKSETYEISRCENDLLTRLIDTRSSGNHAINNLIIVNNIVTLENSPLFQERATLAVKLVSDYSTCCSPSQSSLCLNLAESSNLFLILIYEICTVINAIYQNTLGNVIRSVISICSLIRKSFLFYQNEKKILKFLNTNNSISSFKRGGYIASAAALNHARKSALSLLAWKTFSLAIAIFSILSIIAFIVGCVFAFNSGGIFSDTFFMSPAAWTLGGSGLAFLFLGLLSVPYSHCSHYCRKSAVDSIHRSLLCLYISEQIRESSEDSDNLASVVARNSLSPYSELLDPQVFSFFTPSEESLRRHNIEQLEHIQNIRIQEIFTSIPPPYKEFPPTYAEVMEEDRKKNHNNKN
ncbi:hypothetical protein O1W69_04865 [Chlamydia sp. 12-01]|uniref:inclusion membrane protein GarD n=1 Tax=Chlamydia sp. 12-01 TaxID=3002742 RepID=UPI0035D3FFF7